jgi:TnpA family transposase
MRDFHRWQVQYLGTSTFPKTLTRVELEAFFTYSPDEMAFIRSRKIALRIAAAIQIGFLRMTGCPLATLKVIPQSVLKHVAEQVGAPAITIATLRALYKREMTFFTHQDWALELLGFVRPTPAQMRWLLPFLKREASQARSVDVLMERGKVWLYQHQFVYPGDRPVRDYARQAIADSENQFLKLIQSRVTPQRLFEWESAVLASRQDTGRTHLEWLQQAPKRNSSPQLRRQIEHIDFIKGLGVHELNIDEIPLERRKVYAAQLRNYRPAKFRELQEPTRTLRLVSFLQVALLKTTDTAVLMGGMQVRNIMRKARDRATSLEAKESLTSREMLDEIFAAVDDTEVSDRQFRTLVRDIRAGYEHPTFPTHAAAFRWAMSDPGTPVRALLAELRKLDLKADPDQDTHAALTYLRTLYGEGANELPVGAKVPYGRKWSDIIEGPDRARAMRALEAATLLGLRKSLRAGSVWIDHSESFRSRDNLLIPRERWETERKARFEQLNLPLAADSFLDRLLAAYSTKLQAVEAALSIGEIAIEDGAIRLPRLKALGTSPEVERNREALFKQIGSVQFPDLILQVDSLTGFSKTILGRPARSELELLQVYSGMLAHGTSLDATGVALMVPQLQPNHILSGMQFFEERETIRAANEVVSSFHRRLPLAATWGDGTLASSDMMSLDVYRQVWAARLDYKRGTPSIGTYTTVSDTWSIIYDQPIVLNERQAGAAIEGAIRQQDISIERLAVDTHGYTDFAMGMAKLLGFDLCPRLARLAERRLFVPKGMQVPDVLADVVEVKISIQQIKKYWDELVRIAASIETGQTTATVALARFGSSSSDNPVYRAGIHLGKLVRSLYLCDYFTSEPFRRTINRILVHGEAVHQLQRAIYMGAFSKPRGQREEELFAISGSLTLMTNLCLAWTASEMQEALTSPGPKPWGSSDREWLTHVSPAHFRNINFRGTFSFPVEQYRDRVLEGARRAANG